MVVLSVKDIEQILFGCAVLGTGGGGDLQRGIETVRRSVKEKVVMLSVDEFDDDSLAACPYFVGSVSPLTGAKKLAKKVESPVVEFFKLLERYIGKKFEAVFPTEPGGGNTAAAFEVAARAGVAILDGDPVGELCPKYNTPASTCSESR